jgi:hypothetical protein
MNTRRCQDDHLALKMTLLEWLMLEGREITCTKQQRGKVMPSSTNPVDIKGLQVGLGFAATKPKFGMGDKVNRKNEEGGDTIWLA